MTCRVVNKWAISSHRAQAPSPEDTREPPFKLALELQFGVRVDRVTSHYEQHSLLTRAPSVHIALT